MTRINTNVSSLLAQTVLGRSNNQLQESLTRLSTGLRINTGKDDPSGLIASENLRSDIVSVEAAISNSERANQIIATADSALGQVSSLLNDIRGLVTESANSGALSDAQIEANQLQVDSSLEALNRIAQTTSFQGRRLLDGSLDFISTAGTVANISSFQIDQANLGTAGQVAVDIDISAAATQSQLTSVIAAGTPAVQATGITGYANDSISAVAATGITAFSADVTTPGVAATGVTGFASEVTTAEVNASATLTLENGSIVLSATDGGALEGSAGNTVDLQFVEAATGAGTVTTNRVGDQITVTVSNAGVTIQNIADQLTTDSAALAITVGTVTNGANQFDGTNEADGLDDVTTFSQVLGTAGVDEIVGTDVLTVTNTDGSGATVNGATVTIIESAGQGAGTASAQFNGSNIEVTVNNSDTALTVIRDAIINDIAGYSAAVSGDGDGNYQSAGAGNYVVATIGDGSNGGTVGVNQVTGTDVLTITGTTGDGADANGTTVSIVEDALQGAGTASAALVSGNIVVTVNNQAGTTALTTIATAITNDVAGFTGAASGAGDGNYINGGGNAGQIAVVGDGSNGGVAGVTAATGADVLTVTADNGGTGANDVTVTFIESASQTAGTASAAFNGSNIEVTVNNAASGSVAFSTIATAIGTLNGYSAAASGAGDGNYVTGAGNAGAQLVVGDGSNGGTVGADATGGLIADLVFELSGLTGSEVLDLKAGQSAAQIALAVNLVSDSTGITATDNSGTLELTSSDYGSNAFTQVNVISEGTGGTFGSLLLDGATNTASTRANGTDIAATVNGVSASGDGNTLSVNTSTLDLTVDVTAGSALDIDFNITGGGALFQLGPDVVSNQQARLGIQSVNTARLGGSSGLLFSLSKGKSASLDNDPNLAASIVEQAIDQVTGLRGRLGAFQKTTIDTNINALNDVLVNLTEAESVIRDADFAAESAALTRAQILVQSGTSVLGIANSNPQNVLSLLR